MIKKAIANPITKIDNAGFKLSNSINVMDFCPSLPVYAAVIIVTAKENVNV
jgi:hypothetical protein